MANFNIINRRQFLAHSAAFAAAASLPLRSWAQDSMLTRPIPGTDESLPVIGLGAPDIFGQIPPEGRDLPKAIIQTMVDLGGRLIDTPAFFRRGEPVIGELLTEMGLQEELFLTGKITVNGKQEGIAHLERTIELLNKRQLDLLMVHNMREMDLHWPTLREWKDAGRVRYIGVSQTSPERYGQLEEFMRAENPDFIMASYSIQRPEAADRILPLAQELGIAVLTAGPFSNGRYFGLVGDKQLPKWAAEFDCQSWAQFSLKYIISHPAVNCVLTETSKVHHAEDNMRAGHGRLPDEATRQKMSEIIGRL